ncbi:SpoIIE family protein phosphatase [Marinomonas sp. M1K-6]|uniref:SpoIIE family protein phosphatase n=1 Tax=Marinomonas profundi TaxID=2726122 RepID=A0A847R1A5_9GAMM|nr:biofilm regulation protein phosphatase SiaA [Marinomonas profundi]NLQ17465.1 SpoIIE family protein phosphatase [Marinomonas profundi]UDV01987.1 biofilm regulation protein phosphatase SiaA [Marinomonas profundi]
MARWGLRGKSLFALAASCLFALLIIVVMGGFFIQKGQEYSAENYATSFTQLNYQRILTPVSREVALAERFANSTIVKSWLQRPDDPALETAWLEETQGYLDTFQNHAMFIVNDGTLNYYFADQESALSRIPKYTLSQQKNADSWYFAMRETNTPFNINVNYDEVLKVMKVWINFQVRDHGRFIGLAGTGFSLELFIKQFAENPVPGVTPFILNADGTIEIHQNEKLIAYNAQNGDASLGSIYSLLDDDESKQTVQAALASAQQSDGNVVTVPVMQDGHKQLMSFVYFPLLDWFVVTNVDLASVSVFDSSLVLPAVSVFVLMLVILLIVFGFVVERLLIAPIRQLQRSAKNIASGSYDVTLATGGNDEIGELGKTFNKMAQQVRNHTQELEHKVQARTAELELAHAKVLEAHRKIGASIDYASLIQKSILPDRQMRQFLGEEHSVIWRPRDVVGGDFYVFHPTDDGCVLGIVDCAGHGVPGALMTMLIRAAIDYAIARVGIADPAALLSSIDDTLRSMLNEDMSANKVATNADVGLVYVPKKGDFMRFSGAKIALYGSNGKVLIKHNSGRRALGDRRRGHYENTELPMSGWTYYMTTDGFLDQSGGDKNFGFGNQRFETLIKDNAALSLKEQAASFEFALDEYMGDQPQRDDITLLSFRFDANNNAQ